MIGIDNLEWSGKLPKMTSIKNRITKHGEASPRDLVANPRNWRKHPSIQEDALAGVLDDIGWVQSVIVNERSGRLVDGHLRVKLAEKRGEKTIPVVYVDLSDEEEAEVLATIDPLSAMADADAVKLEALLHDVSSGSAAVQELLSGLAESEGMFSVDAIEPPELASGDRDPFQQMTFTLHDDQAKIVNDALKTAKNGGCESILNENSNGTALSFICEAFIG